MGAHVKEIVQLMQQLVVVVCNTKIQEVQQINVIVYQPIPIAVLVILYAQKTVQVIQSHVLQIVQEVIVILKEIVHVIIIVEQMESTAITIYIHVRVIPKLQEILLVYAMFKLVLHMVQNVVITVQLIRIVLTYVNQIVLVFAGVTKIHAHVTLTVLQMIGAVMCVDVIIIVHVIHKLQLVLITAYVTLSVLLNMDVLVTHNPARTVVQTVLVSMYVLVRDIKLIAIVIISVGVIL